MKLNKSIPLAKKPVIQEAKEAVKPTVKQTVKHVGANPTSSANNVVKQGVEQTVKQEPKETVKQVVIPVQKETVKQIEKPILDTAEFTEGILLSDKYKIETLDVLNTVLKERYTPALKKDTDAPEEEVEPEEAGPAENKWKIIAYCPNIESAFKTIVDREINTTVSKGLEEVVKKIEELKHFKTKVMY